MHGTHAQKIVKTKDGNIVLEKPNLLRTSALSNSIYTYILTDEDLLKVNSMETDEERNKFMQIKTLKKGYTTMQLSVLAYIVSAPFHLNDYSVEPILDLKAFLEYADSDLLTELSAAIKELGTIDPLHP